MQTAAEPWLVAKLFARFADPSRLAILTCLRDGGRRSVGEIVDETGLSQSNTSNHLHCLHCCGLVSRTSEGRRVFYEIADARVEAMLDLASELLREVASGVGTCVRYGA